MTSGWTPAARPPVAPDGAPARGEHWWPVALAIVVTVVLYVPLPAKYRERSQQLRVMPIGTTCHARYRGHGEPGGPLAGGGVPGSSAVRVACMTASAPLASARRQGQTPSISISREKLRNVRISTISPRTRTLSSVGETAMVLIKSAATRIYRESSSVPPNAWRSAL